MQTSWMLSSKNRLVHATEFERTTSQLWGKRYTKHIVVSQFYEYNK